MNSNLLATPDAWRNADLDDLVFLDREKLNDGTDGGFSFYYIDISSVSEGSLRLPASKITFRGAPSRARKIVHRKDVLMATVRPNLKAFAYFDHTDDDCIASTGFAVLSAKPGVDPLFVLYSILSDAVSSQIESHVVGSNYPAINSKDIRRLKILAPSRLSEQQKIARILTTLGILIEKTECLIAKYQAIKQGLMHDLFSRGVDAHGHLRPSQADAPELYKQSDLGLIPKDWRVATIGELFDKRTEHGKEGLPVMSVVMRDGLVERSSVDRRVESNLPPQGHALVLKGDIAYNMMRMWQGVLGRASFDCLVSPAYVVLKPKDTINTRFAAFLFSDERSIQKFRQFSQGVVDDRLRLYFHDLVHIPFAVPTSLDEQEEIANRIEACNKRIATEKTALDQYQSLRLGLMQDLLTGKVRVMPDEAGEAADA